MDDKKDFLLELGTEDLPARLVSSLSDEFAKLICAQLQSKGLAFDDYQRFSTPRRLCVIAPNLDCKQADQIIERKGPAVANAFDDKGAPTKAAIGFAQSCGVEVNQLESEKDSKKPKLVYREKRKGKETDSLLPEIINQSVTKLTIPKRMRWNDSGSEFIRPIRWVLAIFGTSILDFEVSGLKAGNVTYGHRFHSNEPIVVKHASAYKELLKVKGHVIADSNERKQNILDQINKLTNQAKATATFNDELLDEITNLVEWPVAILGEFDKKFLQVHQAVLISTMQDNQKYIPLLSATGELLSKFIIISNIESKSPNVVKQGNEKVIVPRFEDAMFFWQRDKQKTLEQRYTQLKTVVFEKQLGSLHDKSERLIKLSTGISHVANADQKDCQRAARLSKCDLLTEMVGEFPKLQGVVGNTLAKHDGENENVCIALEQQYLPRYAGDDLPTNPVGQSLALADRIDTLVGIFAIGKKPTGLKDPYGLRRAALAVLRILIETPLNMDLYNSLKQAAAQFDKKIKSDLVVDEVFDYILERLRSYFAERNFAPDIVDSVLANRPTSPSDIAARIKAIANFRNLPDADSLAAANKRIRNILKKIDHTDISEVDKNLFKEDAENVLHSSLNKLSNEVEELFNQFEYEKALNKLAYLRQPVDQFFDDVMVMDEDETLKTNRIALLYKIDSLFMKVADFSRLQS